MQTSTFRLILNLLLVLSLILPSAATATTDTGMGAAESPAVFADSGLYRTRIVVDAPARWARLAQLDIVILERYDDGALALVDAAQLETLARLDFQPRASDELNLLMQAQGEGRAWLSASMQPLITQGLAVQTLRANADELSAQATTAVSTAAAELRVALHALSAEQQAGIASSISPDSDGDGLTNTEEGWWCTDPMNPDSDGDGVSDGDEVAALKAWMANQLPGPPASGKPFAGWPPLTTSAGYPDRAFACQDDDRDSVPDLAERWVLGLNMNRESTDRDKFDDGQELFGITEWGWGALPRVQDDAGYIFAEMPTWVKAPGNHPFVAAFPVPEIDVVASSLKVETVTTVTTDHVISEGTEKSYSTATTEGTSTSVADTVTWNDWQETSITQPVSGLSAQGGVPPGLPPLCPPGLELSVPDARVGALLAGGCKVFDVAWKQVVKYCSDDNYENWGFQTCKENVSKQWNQVKEGTSQGLKWIKDKFSPPTPLPCNPQLQSCLADPSPQKLYCPANLVQASELQSQMCISGRGLLDPTDRQLISRESLQANVQDSSVSQGGTIYQQNSSGQIEALSVLPIAFPQPHPTITSTSGKSWGGAQTTTNTQYKEHTITNGEAFSNGESWGTATAVNSAHAADLWFTYKIRNTGMEYARQICDIAFNVFIGDDPNPVYTYFVDADRGGDGCFNNFMPGEEHQYSARTNTHAVPLSLEQLKRIEVGDPQQCLRLRSEGKIAAWQDGGRCPGGKVRIVVEDFTYGLDELFYRDAANAGVLLAMEDGTDDGDEAIDTYLIPTWGNETVLDVLGRYFPHTTDADGMLTAVWTPEYRSDTPAWCVAPRVVGIGSQRTLWCKHALSTADWWNIYTDGMGDGSEGFQDTLAAPGQTALFRFNSDSDLDGYSDRSEERLGTDPHDPASFPRPELIAGVHSIKSGNQVTATLSLLNTGVYDAYGVEAVMIAPDDSVSITNNTVGGSGRVRAQKQVIVGSRIAAQTPLPAAWLAAGHAQPTASGYYTGAADRTYTFTAADGGSVGAGTLRLNWNDGAGGSGTLAFGAGYLSPTLLDVSHGVKLGLLSGTLAAGESFTVAANTPRDTFQYTIAAGRESDFTPPVVLVSYNDPQGNHRFVTPINLNHPTENLAPHSGKMRHGEGGIEIVTTVPFNPAGANATTLVAQAPASVQLVDAHLFLEFIAPDGTVVREEATTVTLEPGPNVVEMSWDPINFNPAYDPDQDYIVMAFFTDWQGNILDTAARPVSSFQEDPRPAFVTDASAATWDFGAVPQGQKLEHTFTLANTGMMDLKAIAIGTGARADQAVPGTTAWTDTGLDLAAGDALGIRASGQVCYGGSGTTLCYGPDGAGETADAEWTAPSAAKHSLVARIGNGSPFFIGSTYTGVLSTGGRLYLGANDKTGTYSDNGGTYSAHIEIQGAPTSLGNSPSFSVAPADTASLDVTIDTYYLPTGAFDRTILVRTSDPTYPTQIFRVQGTVLSYVAPAQASGVSPYRPWDLHVAVAGDGAKRSVVAFDDTIAADAASVQPLRVYDTDRQTQLGSGRENARADASLGLPTASVASSTFVESDFSSATEAEIAAGAPGPDADPSGVTSIGSMFGDGRDGAMPASGNLDNNNGFGAGTVNGSAGSTSISVTDRHAVWRINPGDVVLIHQTQGTGAGNWELNKAVSNFTGSGTFTLANPLKYTYSTGGTSNRAQILRVPQYSTCNVTGTVTPLTAWNGTWGGIFAVMCNGTMTVSGAVIVDGGNGATASEGNPPGGSGGGFRGGKADGVNNDNYGGGDAGEGTPGPGSWEGDGTPNGNGGGAGDGTPQRGNYGTGGGGGNGTPGTNSTSGGIGAGGYAAGNPELTNMVFGGGGGGSNDNPGNSIGGGGGGGGIIVLQSSTINITGVVRANGGQGGGNKWGGGGGAGGSILIRGKSVNVGNSSVVAVGGAARASGGAGGVGRIRIEYCDTASGSTNPVASVAKANFCYGTIKGRAFSDTNGNGVQDAGEPGLPNVTVTVGSAGNVTTNSNGDYTKTVNAPGSYTVSVTPPSGYHCIIPCSVATSINPDETKTVNFALQPRVSVAGKVFHDTNNNGAQNSGEAGVASVSVRLNTGATRTTASDGSYSFGDLQPGSYSVTVTVPDGYVSTTDTSIACNLAAGQTCNAHFGILQYTVEKVTASDHANRLFLPESFTGGRRYWVQYGRPFAFAGTGALQGQVRLPKAVYQTVTLDVLLTAPVSSNVFIQAGLDIGCDNSQEWSLNANLEIPATRSTGNVALGFNRYLSTASPDGEGMVTVPLCVNLNQSGQIFLTNLIATPSGVSDIGITPTDITLAPTNPIEGEAVDIEITVHNNSPFAANGFVVSAFATVTDWGEWYVGSAFVSNLPAGSATQVNIPWNTLGFTGAVPVRAVVDPYNRVAETDETNNDVTANLTILTRPDLHIPSPGLETDPGIALDDAEPVVGQAVQVSVLVQNNGQTGAGASTLALSVEDPNGAASQICAPTPAVPGQSSVTETCAWTPSLPGRHRLYAAADDGGAVNESNESNNRQWRDVYVGFAGPLQLDSGGASDSKYSASNGYGYIDEGAADTVSHCGSAPHQTYRHDPGGAVLYRFDHLLPGHFYHLDLVLFDCAPGAGRQQYVKINGYTVAGPINLSDGQVHRLSLLVDPALYTTRSIVVTVSESESGLGAIVNEISLHDIDYRYADAGSGNDPAYNAERGHGWLDTPAISSWGSRPFETARVDQADNEIRYRFDNLDPGKRYLLRFTFYQGSGVNRMQQIRVNGQSLGADFTLVSGQTYIESRDVPLSAYSTNHDIIASVVRLDTSVGPLISEIALEQRTQASTAACQITATPYRATARGNVTILGQPAPAGSVITAENPRGEVVGCMVTTSAGIYIMTIYGEDTTATPPIPGMRAGEQVIFRVDGSLAVAGPTMVWQNGQVVWVNLDAGAIQGQSILLNPNWNLFSINLQPPATTLSTVLGSISGKYCRVLAENSIYDCTVPERFHTLKDILPGRGYWLRLEGGASANLQVQGTQVDPATPINLHQGWNWIGYLPAFSQPIADALAGIAGDYLWVADGAGSFYDPLFPDFSNLHLMEPGKGYLLYATTDTTLIYPNPVAATGAAGVVAASAVCQEAQPTPYFMVLFGGLTFDGQPAPVGVRVHALTARGEVAGCFQVNTAGQYGFVPIFGADTVEPPVPGFFAGEPITLLVDGLPVSLPEPLLWRDSKAPQRLDLHLPSPQRLYLPTIRQ